MEALPPVVMESGQADGVSVIALGKATAFRALLWDLGFYRALELSMQCLHSAFLLIRVWRNSHASAIT